MLSPASALSWPLRAFAGWALYVHCPSCRLTVRPEVDRLRAARGDWRLADEVLARLRCSRCGQTPGSVRLADGVEGMERPVQSVEVRGGA